MKNNLFRKWLALSALFTFLCFSPHGLLRAQSTANYAFTTNTSGSLGLDMNGNTVDMSTGTTQVLATNTSQDQSINATAITFPAGFEFFFGGNRFTSYFATSNGLVQLGNTAVIGGGTYSAAGGTLAAPRFSAFDGDLGTGTTGGIFGKLIGTGPNRCYVIEFRNMNLMWNTYTNDGTYQVRFYESTGVVEYVYGTMFCNTTASASDATPEVGFSWGSSVNQSLSVNIGTSAIDLSGVMVQNTVTAGTNITNLNSAAEGSRRVYRFTPPVPASPTGLSFASIGSSYMNLNWTDNATNEVAYLVYRSTDGISYSLVGTTAANATSFFASGLTPNTLYYWKVYAVSEGALSSPVLSGTQSTLSCASISGIKTVGAGGDYPNLSLAFADINGCSLAGNTELQLIAGYPALAESYPIAGPTTTPVGAFTLKVYPAVSGLSITSNNATGTLNLNNSYHVTIDGRVNQTGAKDLVISNTGTGYAVQFVNDANANTLQYVTLHSANSSTSSGTIVFAGSTGTTGNDNNLIDNCDIKDGASTPLNAIYSAGTSTTVDNSGNTVSNSNIYNYFGAGSASNGILLASNSAAWTINANKFYQTATRTSTSGNTHRAINIITSGANGYVVTNNVIGYASSAGTGVTTYAGAFANRFFGIEITTSNTGTASLVQGNTITAVSLSTTSGATAAPGIFCGVSVLGGTVSVGNVTPNVVGATTGTGSVSVTTTSSANIFGIHASSTGTLIVSNNVVGSLSAAGNAAGISCGIVGINTAGASTATTVSGNTIGGSTANSIASGTSGVTTAATTVSGIATAGAATTLTVSGNAITNLTNYSSSTTSVLNGIVSSGSPVTASITNNTVSNTSLVSGTLNNISTASPTTLTVSGNTLFNASASGASGTINGISNGGGTTSSIFKNKIYNLNAAGATSAVNGILASAGTTVNIYNNVIGDLKTPTTSAVDPVRGISVTSTSATTTYRVYYNSIYLNASSSGTNFGTTGVYHTVSATATTAALDMRNNIVINESTPAGTGITVAFRRSGTALGNFASTSNRNLLYAGTPSATRLLMYDGTTSYQTIIAYQTAVAPREINSFTGETAFTGAGYGTAGNFFISTTPSAANYLTPVAGITTQAESGAINITTPAITDDYASVIRQGNAGYTGSGTSPDLGAFEFAGVTPAPVITLNSVTPPASTQCVASARVVSVNITTASGTITGANLTYTVNGTAQTPIVMTNTSGSTWTATIPVPTPANATIAWGVAASNSLGLNGSYVGATYADEPLTGVTGTATVSTATVCAGSPTNLSASLTKTGNAILGSGSSTTSGSGTSGGNYVSPFSHYFGGYKAQYVIRASELTAAGLSAGNITALYFDVTTAGTTYNAFSMDIAPTASTVASATFLTGTFTNVYSGNLNVATTGLFPITFSTPFNWDGTSNIIVQFCWSNNNTGGTAAEVKYDATSFVSQAYYRADSQTPATICGTTTATSTQSNRPKIVFTGNTAPAITSVNWMNGATSVGTGNPFTANPTVTTTYTANITSLGCVVSPAPTVTVNVNPLPASPTATNSAQCGTQIPTASVASNSGLPTPTFNWYAASTGGSALQSATSTTYNTNVASTTTFYVSELNTVTGCESARVPVTVTVATADNIAAAANNATICIGSSVNLSASNLNPTPNQSYTYTWTNAQTGSGLTSQNGAAITVTPTQPGNYTYNLSGVDGGCNAVASVSVTVNPYTATLTPVNATCNGANNGSFTLASESCGTASTYSVDGGAFGAIPTNLTPGTHNVIVKNTGGFQTGSISVTITEPIAVLAPLGIANATVCQNGTSAILTVPGTALLTTTATFGLAAQPAVIGTSAAPTTTAATPNVIATATLPALPAGATITGVTFTMNGLTPLGGSWGNDVYFGFSGAYAADYQNGTGAPGSTTAFNFTRTYTGTYNTAGGTVSLHYYDRYDDNAGAECTFPTGASVGTLTVTYTVPNPSTNWYSASSGGTLQGTGTPFQTIGTGVLPNANTPGTYTFYAEGTNGTCVSATRTPVTVTVNAAPTVNAGADFAVCSGSPATLSGTGTAVSYSWNNGVTNGVAFTPSATNTYTVTGTGANSCTAQDQVVVTVNPLPTVNAGSDQTVCSGSSVTLNGSGAVTYSWNNGVTNGVAFTATATTTYTVTGTDANGCQNTDQVVVTVNPLPTVNAGSDQTVCSGSSVTLNGSGAVTYSWNNGVTNGVAFTATATTTYTVTGTDANGCQNTDQVVVTVNNPTTGTDVQTACGSYTWIDGVTYVTSNNTATFTIAGGNSNGCDSVVTLNLTIYNPTTGTDVQTACVSYTWIDGVTYMASNNTATFTIVGGNSNGCDSIVTLNLTILQPTTSSVTLTECTSYTWPENGMTYTTSGAYTHTLPGAAANGCDSIITLNLTIIQPTTSSVSATACSSYTWAQNGMTYIASGVYTDTIPNASGCDSVITLNLTINMPTSSVFTVSTCSPSYTWAQNGMTYSASGMYNDTITNAAGCDSVVTLNLTITTFVATATDNGNATATASAGTTYQWINCATNTPIAGATAQTFAPTANGSYAVIVSNGTCSDTSNCVNITNVGIKENTISTIEVHPNPTHDVVFVTMDASSAVVEVMDAQGKLVQTTQIKSGDQIDLSAYERGVYTLRIKTDLGTSIERIVKN